MYVKDGCLWGITIDKNSGEKIHTNHGKCDFDEINLNQVAIRTLYTNWKIK